LGETAPVVASEAIKIIFKRKTPTNKTTVVLLHKKINEMNLRILKQIPHRSFGNKAGRIGSGKFNTLKI
jgi:hypothetical protein